MYTNLCIFSISKDLELLEDIDMLIQTVYQLTMQEKAMDLLNR